MLPNKKQQTDDIASGSSSVVPRDDVKPNDVLFGRGAGIARCQGNVRLRRLIRERLHSYTATSRILFKDNLARDVVQEVRGRGGRFLRRDGHTWVIVDNEKDIVIKVKQNFRDHAKSMYTFDVGEEDGGPSNVLFHQSFTSLDQQIGGIQAQSEANLLSATSAAIPLSYSSAPQWPQQPVQPPQQVRSTNQLDLIQQLLSSIQPQESNAGSSMIVAPPSAPSEQPPATASAFLLKQPNTSNSQNQDLLQMLQSLANNSSAIVHQQSCPPLSNQPVPVLSSSIQPASYPTSSTQAQPVGDNLWLVQAQNVLAKLLLDTLAAPYTGNTSSLIEQIREVLQEVNGQLQTLQPALHVAALTPSTSHAMNSSSNTSPNQDSALQVMQQLLATALQQNNSNTGQQPPATTGVCGSRGSFFQEHTTQALIHTAPIEAWQTPTAAAASTSHGMSVEGDTTQAHLYRLLCSVKESSQVSAPQQNNPTSPTQRRGHNATLQQQQNGSSASSNSDSQTKKRSATDASLGNSGI